MPFQRHSRVITLPYCRLSFPHIFEAQPITQQGRVIGDPRYSTLVVLSPKALEMVRAAEGEVIRASWPEWGGTTPPAGVTLTRALREGAVARPGDANLEGKYFVSANAKQDSPPLVFRKVQGNLVRVDSVEGRPLIYSGCEAHVEVGIYSTQLQVAQPQINVGLNQILLTERPMKRFDGRHSAEQAFGTVDELGEAPPVDGDAGMGEPPADDPMAW